VYGKNRKCLRSTDATDFHGIKRGGLKILNRKRIERRNPDSLTVMNKQLP